ncbi:MAG: DNA polymerase ligase N-terminal domain-containing protein [Planctomycetota bacterium]
MLRYVLLRHECPEDYRDGPHWDLMLEHADALRTWSLLTLPAAWSKDASAAHAVEAKELPDHRVAYLTYEGEVSGGRGTVKQQAAGEYAVVSQDDDQLLVQATSGALVGEWRLTREQAEVWRLEAGR